MKPATEYSNLKKKTSKKRPFKTRLKNVAYVAMIFAAAILVVAIVVVLEIIGGLIKTITATDKSVREVASGFYHDARSFWKEASS